MIDDSKMLLFKSYCTLLHNVALWKYFSVTVFNKNFSPVAINALINYLSIQEWTACHEYSLISPNLPQYIIHAFHLINTAL